MKKFFIFLSLIHLLSCATDSVSKKKAGTVAEKNL